MAHNGFTFNYPILLAEVERRPRVLALSTFEKGKIHFSDTLPLLKKVHYVSSQPETCVKKNNCYQMKKDKQESLSGVKSLAMENLHNHVVGTSIEGNNNFSVSNGQLFRC